MSFINVGADNKGVFSLCEPLGKFYAQPIGFLRRNFSRTKGLTDMISNYIVFPAQPSRSCDILTLCQHELSVSYPAVTLIASNEPAMIGLLRIGYIVDDVADRLALGAAFADMQRHDACGCHDVSLLSKKWAASAAHLVAV